MSVILTHYSTETVLPACARAIEALPNLHTLQIVRTDHKMCTLPKNAFKEHVFPQVRTISLPSYAHHILRRCPEVGKVICISQRNSRILSSAIAKRCKKVEEVQGFRGSIESTVPHLLWQVCKLLLRTCEGSTESTFDNIRLHYLAGWFPFLKPKMPGLNVSF